MTTRPAAPPPPAAAPQQQQKKSPRATIPTAVGLSFTSGRVSKAQRIVLYGTGGIGKSTLAAFLPAPAFIDVEHGTEELNVLRDSTCTDWPSLRGKLASLEAKPQEGVRTIVIDTMTTAEEFAREYVVETRPNEKGKRVDSIEGYGWGKGWQFVYDEVTGLLADLDRIVAKGVNVCMIAHDVPSVVPNPSGEDFLRWEPRLYNGDKNHKGSVRERIKEWADHVLFIGYDVAVEDGKARGGGSRTIWSYELPTHIAKSRSKQMSIAFDLQDPGAVWRELGIS